MKPIASQNPIVNPLDELFNTAPSRYEQEYNQITEGELAELEVKKEGEAPEKDAEDAQIDKNIDGIYDAALAAFNDQTAYMQVIEPRYAARNAEVAANYLNIALNAAATRARVKGDRKRTAQFVPFTGNKTQNNIVVASREDILRMVNIDAEVKELK